MFSKIMDKLGRRRVITDRSGKVPYLIRYYLFLKERKNFPFNITLHKVLVSDEPVLHDHPWSWGALIIKQFRASTPTVTEGNTSNKGDDLLIFLTAIWLTVSVIPNVS